jgi:hypothetical protein
MENVGFCWNSAAKLIDFGNRSSLSRPRVESFDDIMPLFVSAFRSFWPPKATADYQTLSFSVSFYKIRLGKNHSKST